METRVRLDVGGKVFTTTVDTLRTLPETRLGRLVTETKLNTEKELFFDRNPKIMNSVLDLYRTGELHLPENLCSAVAARELEFWEIPTTLIHECCWRNFENHHSDAAIVREIDDFLHDPYDKVEAIEKLSMWNKIWFAMEHPSYSLAAKIWTVIYFMVVIMAVLWFSLETVAIYREYTDKFLQAAAEFNVTVDEIYFSYDKIGQYVVTQPEAWLRHPQRAMFAFFVLEFLVKLVTCPNKREFVRHPRTWLEFLLLVITSVTFVVEYHVLMTKENFTSTETNSLLFFYSLSMLRSFRIIYLAKHFQTMKVKLVVEAAAKSLPEGLKYLVEVFQALSVCRKKELYRTGLVIVILSAKSSVKELLLLVILVLTFVVMFGSLAYVTEFVTEDFTFSSIPHGMWWAIVTMTTVGYGDVSPVGVYGQLVGAENPQFLNKDSRDVVAVTNGCDKDEKPVDNINKPTNRVFLFYLILILLLFCFSFSFILILLQSKARLNVQSDTTLASDVTRQHTLPLDPRHITVEIDVGGKLFKTKGDTLCTFPQTRLGKVVDDASQAGLANVSVFFDRTPRIFCSVLDFYRTGELHLPKRVCGAVVERELKFWNIPTEMIADCCWKDVRAYRKDCRITHEIDHFLSKVEESQDEGSSGGLHRTRDMLTISFSFFTVEIIFRMITAPRFRTFMRKCRNVFDLFLVVHNAVVILAEETIAPDLNSTTLIDYLVAFYRMALLRVLRVFYISRSFDGMRVLLLSARASMREMMLLIVCVLSFVIMFGSLAYVVELLAHSFVFHGVPHAMWWAIVTMTTVGYGEVVPGSVMGKIVGALCALVGVLVLALPVAVIAESFSSYFVNMAAHKQMINRGNFLAKHPEFRIIRRRHALATREEKAFRMGSQDLTVY
nr:hypothetical protein BaRGS_032024 [Batillaria attramentaria]